MGMLIPGLFPEVPTEIPPAPEEICLKLNILNNTTYDWGVRISYIDHSEHSFDLLDGEIVSIVPINHYTGAIIAEGTNHWIREVWFVSMVPSPAKYIRILLYLSNSNCIDAFEVLQYTDDSENVCATLIPSSVTGVYNIDLVPIGFN